MYFIVGTRGGTTARFQLSFKYRLFDSGAGFGQERPWLSGLYFGYTQNSLWDLRRESKAFRDTSYRPSFFWKWERADEARLLRRRAPRPRARVERRRRATRSRSINIAFVRPEWRWQRRRRRQLRLHAEGLHLPRQGREHRHRRLPRLRRLARALRLAAGNWIATTLLRYGTAGKGSVLLDVSRRMRDMQFGPVGTLPARAVFRRLRRGSILDYNVKRKSQIRIGFAIVP